MINGLRKLAALSAFEWWLLLLSLLMLPLVAALLRVRGFNRTRAILGHFIPENAVCQQRKPTQTELAHVIARMVSIAANRGPYRANCLKQALLIWWLLARRGLASEIHFGVRKEPQETFGAHAWVEFAGMNLCDSEALQQEIVSFGRNRT